MMWDDQRMQRLFVCVLVLGLVALPALLSIETVPGSRAVKVAAQTSSGSIRFFGNGVNDIDRVKIRLDGPARPIDVGATDFTIEWWLRSFPGENPQTGCSAASDAWIYGNIVIDRDIYFNGDFGDFGISILDRRIAFGVGVGAAGATLCGTRIIDDGAWHHIAVQRRRSDGQLRLFVDGQPDGEIDGPNGDLSYRNNRPTSFPNDPFLVLGAEKHDAGSAYPSYRGWLDELRISTVLRYSGTFSRPIAPFVPDTSTVGLYHFDEGSGDTVGDSSGAAGGPSNGLRRFGGSPAGPEWTAETPFSVVPPSPTATTPPIVQTVSPVPASPTVPPAQSPTRTPTCGPAGSATPSPGPTAYAVYLPIGFRIGC